MGHKAGEFTGNDIVRDLFDDNPSIIRWLLGAREFLLPLTNDRCTEAVASCSPISSASCEIPTNKNVSQALRTGTEKVQAAINHGPR